MVSDRSGAQSAPRGRDRSTRYSVTVTGTQRNFAACWLETGGVGSPWCLVKPGRRRGRTDVRRCGSRGRMDWQTGKARLTALMGQRTGRGSVQRPADVGAPVERTDALHRVLTY